MQDFKVVLLDPEGKEVETLVVGLWQLELVLGREKFSKAVANAIRTSKYTEEHPQL